MKKTFITLILITMCVLSLSLSACADTEKGLTDYEDGLYFINCDIYQAYNTDEEVFIRLPAIMLNNKGKLNIKENDIFGCNLIYETGSINADAKISIINNYSHYSLVTLSISKDELQHGEYIIEKLSLNRNGESKQYNIGRIKIDIKDFGDNGSLELTSIVSLTTVFDYFSIGLKNTGDFPVQIKNVEFDLNIPFTYDIKSHSEVDSPYSSGEMAMPIYGSSDLSIPINEKRTFDLKIETDSNNTIRFISIKPVLNYSINGEDKQFVLQETIYSPDVNDEDVVSLIKQYQSLNNK